MTHDEMLTKINKDIEDDNWYDKTAVFNFANYAKTLRAIVELHKPRTYRNKFTGGKELYCTQCAYESGVPIDAYLMPQNYPCPTIQAIEKELG